MRIPRRTNSAPIPFGPYILCAENEAKSTFLRSSGTLPAACVASVWKAMPRSLQSAASSAIG
jgi:hypothetical protein